jgi:hypothetical protein
LLKCFYSLIQALFRHVFYQIYQRGQFVVHKRLLIFLQGIMPPAFLSTLYQTNTIFLYMTNFKKLAHNVPAVYDVFAARIRALRSKDQGWQTVGVAGMPLARQYKSGNVQTEGLRVAE